MKKLAFILFVITYPTASLVSQQNNIAKLENPYMDLKSPDDKPIIFAPGIVSTDTYNHASITISPSGTEIYWATDNDSIGHRVIWYSSFKNGKWSKKKIVDFTLSYDGDCPMLSPDGKIIYFLSNRPLESKPTSKSERIWYADRTSFGWKEPQPLTPIINSEHLHWQVSIDNNLNIYFGSERKGTKGKDDIFFSEYKNGLYSEPVSLEQNINSQYHESTPFISPDGTFLIFSRMTFSNTSKSGFYISYKDSKGNWTKAKYMGDHFIDAACPYVSPDGKYIFFKKTGKKFHNVYWISSKIIEELK